MNMVVHWRSVAYATTSLASTMMNSVFNFYYVKIYLHRFHVSESWFNTAQIYFMIWNAINDPLFGYVQDNFSFSWVKTRRHSILYGAPLFAISFLVTWFPWDVAGDSAWISGFQLLFVLCFYDTLFTFVLLAQCALFTEMSQKPEDRIRLIKYSQIAGLMGSGTVFYCEKASHNLEHFHTFQMCCVVVAIVSFAAMYYTGVNAYTEYDLANTEEKEQTAISNHEAQPADGILKQTWQILTQRNFIMFVLMNFCQIYVNAFCDNFSSIICDRLISKDEFSSNLRSVFYGSLFIVPPLFVILGDSIITNIGYYHVIRTSFIVTIVACIGLYTWGPTTWSLVIYYLIVRVCGAGAFKLFNLCLSDIIDADKIRFHRKRPLSAMVFGTNALITKPAMSFAPMITAGILNRHGYERIKDTSGQTVDNPDLDDIMFQLLVWTPLLLAVLQLIVWSFYQHRDSHKTIKKVKSEVPVRLK